MPDVTAFLPFASILGAVTGTFALLWRVIDEFGAFVRISVKCGASIWMRERIASREMLLNAEPLPHVICSRSGTERGGCDEAIDDGDAEGTDDGTGGALSDCKPKGQGTYP